MTGHPTTPMPGEDLKAEKMPGHWLLARLGKRVLRPGGRQLTCQMIETLNICRTDAVSNLLPDSVIPPASRSSEILPATRH